MEAKTPKVLWAATPTPKATQSTYSFALDAEAPAFMPEDHAEAQAVMMAESVLGLEGQGPGQAKPAPEPAKPSEVSEVSEGLPSKGSSYHQQGQCRPCAWMWKPRGCQNAESCEYCHLCPEGELKHRKKLKIAAIRMGALGPSDKAGTAHRGLKLSYLL